MKTILFVCTGNTCRSPMAEGLFRHITRGRGEYRIFSAGVGAVDGVPPSRHAVTAVRELGIDITTQPISDLIQELRDKNVERVFFATAHVLFTQIEEAISACEVMGVEVWLWTGFIKTAIAKPTFDSLGNRPMLVFRSTPEVSWQRVWFLEKRRK